MMDSLTNNGDRSRDKNRSQPSESSDCSAKGQNFSVSSSTSTKTDRTDTSNSDRDRNSEGMLDNRDHKDFNSNDSSHNKTNRTVTESGEQNKSWTNSETVSSHNGNGDDMSSESVLRTLMAVDDAGIFGDHSDIDKIFSIHCQSGKTAYSNQI
jgi:hypothetical protein